MKLNIIAIGTKMPTWVVEGFLEFHKRLNASFNINLIELPLAKRSKQSVTEKIIQQEGDAILNKLSSDDEVIALEVKGQAWSTEALAKKLEFWQQSRKTINFIIGGPDGLAKSCLQRANEKWSLSNLTLPHPLVRLILIEQLYRAHTININHPYHRA